MSVTSLKSVYPRKSSIIWAGKIADLGKKNWVFQVGLLSGELNLTDAFINAGNRKETLASLWDSLAF